jgi:hypothetical protein
MRHMVVGAGLDVPQVYCPDDTYMVREAAGPYRLVSVPNDINGIQVSGRLHPPRPQRVIEAQPGMWAARLLT